MTPSLSTGFSLPVFVAELKDFRGIFDIFSKNAQRGYLELAEKLRSRPLSTLSSMLASGHLTWSFAIAPFISDLEKIYRILCTFRQKTQVFLDKAKALEQARHFRTALKGESLEEILSFDARLGYWAPFLVKMKAQLEPQTHSQLHEYSYNCTMVFDYYVQTLIDIDNRLLGLFQQLGIKPDATIIWELIPFSFIVDWFFDVQEFITEHASLDVISAEVNIHKFMDSFRARVTYSPDWSTLVPESGSSITAALLSNTAEATSCIIATYYARYFTEPDVSEAQFVTDNGFNLSRVALSASLLRKAIK
jgi:hypothetical protein